MEYAHAIKAFAPTLASTPTFLKILNAFKKLHPLDLSYRCLDP
jgi:hypothetical protein